MKETRLGELFRELITENMDDVLKIMDEQEIMSWALDNVDLGEYDLKYIGGRDCD